MPKSAAENLKQAFNDFIDELAANAASDVDDDDEVELVSYTEKQLQKMEKPELVAVAEDLGIETSRKRVNTLIAAILEAQEASDEDDDEEEDDDDTDDDDEDDDEDDDWDDEDDDDEDEDDEDDEEEEPEPPRKVKTKAKAKAKKAAPKKSKKK